MHHPKLVRIPIPEDACAAVREMLATGAIDPNTVLEFMRGDMVCLRGTARAFASRMVREGPNGPRHVPYKPLDPEQMARLRRRGRSWVRLNQRRHGE